MITVHLLGPPRVEVDREQVALSPRAIGVLGRLALADSWIPRQQLLMDLWGDDVEPARIRSLETLISKLRSTLGIDGLIRYEGGAYLIDHDRVRTDVAWFRQHAEQARSAVARADAALARMAALAGLELWQGAASITALGTSTWIDDLEAEVRNTHKELAELASGDHDGERHRPPGAHYLVDVDRRHVAYWAFGSGPIDVVLLGGLATHLEGMWDEPNWVRWVSRLAASHRVICFDKRGTGLSDPIVETPSAEEFAADTMNVLDAVGSTRAVLLCCGEAGMFAPQVAAAEPDRIAGVVFLNAIPKVWRADDYEPGIPAKVSQGFFDGVRDGWGSESVAADLAAPSRVDDPVFLRWAGRYQRLCATPGSLQHLAHFTVVADSRPAVVDVAQPTIVLHTRNNRYFSPKNAAWLVEHLPDAELVLLEGADQLYWLADPETALTAISEFLSRVE